MGHNKNVQSLSLVLAFYPCTDLVCWGMTLHLISEVQLNLHLVMSSAPVPRTSGHFPEAVPSMTCFGGDSLDTYMSKPLCCPLPDEFCTEHQTA